MRPADEHLVARDPALPGLAVLLDDRALTTWLADAGAAPTAPVTRRYLRYKPGTSAVLGARLPTPTGPVDAVVTAYAAGGAAKLAKTARRAAGGLLAADTARLLVATTVAADRDLPGAGVLADPSLLPGWSVVQTLSSKPQRRLVALLRAPDGTPGVLRAYRPGAVAEAEAAYAGALRACRPAGVRLPRVLVSRPALGVLVVEHLPGEVLDRAAGDVLDDGLRRAGAALAGLHGGDPGGLRGPQDNVSPVRAAAAQVARLLPDLAAPVRELAGELGAQLLDARSLHPEPTGAVHGDFSADQVVLTGSGVAVIDLDRAGTAEAAADLASAAAALQVQRGDGAAPLVAALHDGYAVVRPLPPERRRSVHTAAALLRRSPEPFRSCRPTWPEDVRSLVDLAAAALDRTPA